MSMNALGIESIDNPLTVIWHTSNTFSFLFFFNHYRRQTAQTRDPGSGDPSLLHGAARTRVGVWYVQVSSDIETREGQGWHVRTADWETNIRIDGRERTDRPADGQTGRRADGQTGNWLSSNLNRALNISVLSVDGHQLRVERDLGASIALEMVLWGWPWSVRQWALLTIEWT